MSEWDARRESFRKLHERGCFLMPNPWDAGSARYLRHLGFPALATTSAGFAFSIGSADTDWAVSRDRMLGNIASIVESVDLPINADFESGYAHDPEGVAANVRLCVATGVAGLSIEDATGDRKQPLYELSVAVDRIRAARGAIDESKSGVLLTARTECHLVGHPEPLGESVRRLQSFADAGADVLYAPGLRFAKDIAAVVSAVSPRPVNVLVGYDMGLDVRELADLGVRRISVGSALWRAAWTGFRRAADSLLKDQTFTALGALVPFAEVNQFFRDFNAGSKRSL